jgi:hypothetical protein
MKTVPKEKTGRVTAALSVVLLLLLSGCLEKHLVWSPDGNRAAVIAKDGLHLCDLDGRLTPLLLPDVYQVAWLGDSQRLVVARGRKTGDWTLIARAAGSERAAAFAAKAESIWGQLETGGEGGILMRELGKDKDGDVLKVCLRERHGEALRTKVSTGDWADLEGKQVEISELIMARIAGGQIQPGTLLHEGLEKIQDIRVSPGDHAVAFTTDITPGNDNECRLLLARIDGTGAVSVAEHTNLFPDWTADGRTLTYVQASGDGRKKDDLRLGVLAQRAVLDGDGRIKVAEQAEDLAGLMFSNTARVRCLRDGRILFNAVEFSLPIATKDADVEREKLFALDAARQSTLGRVIPRGEEENVPKNLTFFEVSPDEKQVLLGGYEGEVSVLTLVTGEVEVLQKAGDYNLMGAPVWRSAEEITYARRNPTADGKKPERKAEIVRRKVVLQQGDQEKVLSQDWSPEMLESVYSGSDKK